LACQAISNATQRLHVSRINFVRFTKKVYLPWLVSNYICCLHTEWFETFRSAHSWQKVADPYFRVYLTFSQTQLVEMVTWQVQNVKKQGCCNLSSGVALIVWFTTNGMCVKNNTIIYVVRASNSKRDCEHDLYCCLLPWCEALRKCRLGFPIATKRCCDQDVEVVPSSAFTQRTCNRCGLL